MAVTSSQRRAKPYPSAAQRDGKTSPASSAHRLPRRPTHLRPGHTGSEHARGESTYPYAPPSVLYGERNGRLLTHPAEPGEMCWVGVELTLMALKVLHRETPFHRFELTHDELTGVRMSHLAIELDILRLSLVDFAFGVRHGKLYASIHVAVGQDETPDEIEGRVRSSLWRIRTEF